MTKAFKLLQASYTSLRAVSFAHVVACKKTVISIIMQSEIIVDPNELRRPMGMEDLT